MPERYQSLVAGGQANVEARGRSTRSARVIYENLLALWKAYSAGQGMLSSLTIAGRMYQFRTAEDLLTALGHWKAQVDAEDATAAQAAGKSSGSRIEVILK
jgi:hypothetical protein